MEFLQNGAAMIGALAIVTSVITELTKNIGFLKKIPTALQVIVIAVALAVVSYVAQCTANGVPVVWYMIIAHIIAGITAAFVATYGWDKLREIIARFTQKKGE